MSTSAVACPDCGKPTPSGGWVDQQGRVHHVGCGDPLGINVLLARIAELEAALSSLRLTARVLLQNAEGCAVNHYGVDFHLHGEPGWLRDCRRTIEAAESALGVHTLPVDQAK